MPEAQVRSFREATSDDAQGLMELERDTNLVALAHVFPGQPYPEDDVRDRWSRLLADPAVRVEVVGPVGALVVFVAWDVPRLRHLGVHPERWGEGLARVAIDRAVEDIRAGGERPRLWCLAANHRAFAVYRHLGWMLTGRERRAEWPPYPVERELRLDP